MFRILIAAVFLSTAAPAAAAAAEPVPLHELRTFVEVMDRIKSDYVDEVDDSTLMRYAIQGMLRGLDPHSDFLDAAGWDDVESLTTGRYEGLGLEVTVDDGLLKVIAPIDGSPAKAAGVRPGDVILRIDETLVQTLEPADAVARLRGPAGSSVRLELTREDTDGPIAVRMERASIDVVSVRGELLDERFAYIRLSVFNENTARDTLRMFDEVAASATDGISGVVLDLRSNPGGMLESAVDVADLFLEDGLIVRASGRTPSARYEGRATTGDLVHGRPMVVLIDGGSASASEVVAGALQDHERAVVMGEQSFGKGLVQSVLALGPAQGIKLTTARYYTPSGRSIHALGITPDVVLDAADAAGASTGDDRPLDEALALLRTMRTARADAGR